MQSQHSYQKHRSRDHGVRRSGGGGKIFDRMSLIHSADDSLKTMRDGEVFIELF
jgi:hypothetical protein